MNKHCRNDMINRFVCILSHVCCWIFKSAKIMVCSYSREHIMWLISLIQARIGNSCSNSKGYTYFTYIKTHYCESQGQEETGCMQWTSELFTGSAILKLANALNKLPWKLSLSYQDSACSNYTESYPTMEDTGAINPKYQPFTCLAYNQIVN